MRQLNVNATVLWQCTRCAFFNTLNNSVAANDSSVQVREEETTRKIGICNNRFCWLEFIWTVKKVDWHLQNVL